MTAKRKLSPAVHKALREWGRKGGRARARLLPQEKIVAIASKGGRATARKLRAKRRSPKSRLTAKRTA